MWFLDIFGGWPILWLWLFYYFAEIRWNIQEQAQHSFKQSVLWMCESPILKVLERLVPHFCELGARTFDVWLLKISYILDPGSGLCSHLWPAGSGRAGTVGLGRPGSAGLAAPSYIWHLWATIFAFSCGHYHVRLSPHTVLFKSQQIPTSTLKNESLT